jgi:hypothetical protein
MGNGVGIKKQSHYKKRGVMMIKVWLHRAIIYNMKSTDRIYWSVPSLWGREIKKERN